MKNTMVLTVSGVILMAVSAGTAGTAGKTNQIIVNYDPPKNPEYQPIYTLLKEERQTLEKLQEFLSPFRLRWTLELLLTECDGEADAWYGDDKITICYEYIDELWKNMPAETTAGIEPIDTVIGPFVDTVLHEFAHALFDYVHSPILGREEDAADQVGAYIYLQLGKNEARRLIAGTIYTYMLEVEDTDPPSLAEFADEHGTAEQRRFNLLCMAYGADPELFEDLVAWGELPEERAEICEEEFEHITWAYETLIGPYVDKKIAEKVYKKTWLPKEDSHMLDQEHSN